MKLNPLTAAALCDFFASRRLSGSEFKKIYFENLMGRGLKLILILLFLVFGGNAFSQSYNYRNFSTEDGLPQAYIYSLTQDVHGYLWIGTGNGLSRYNGFRFENYTISDSLADNFITCGISDGESLWFGHNNGRISFFNGKKFSSVNIPDTIVSPITHFTKSPDGNIWAGTYADGLLKLSKDSGLLRRYVSKNNVVIISFNFLNGNSLLIGTNSGLLYCRLIETGEIEIIKSVTEIPESKVTCIQKRRNRPGFFIATENDGVFQLTSEDSIFKVSKVITDSDTDFTGIQDIYEDSQSNLWLGSFGNGLIKLTCSETGEFVRNSHFDISNGFPTDNVKSVFEDREGNIWSGNYGKGLTQITPKTFSVEKFDDPLIGNDIFSICLSKKFRWTGTENGLVKTDLQSGKIIKFYSKGSGLPKDTVTTIYSANENELWIGTGKNGVFRMNVSGEKFIKYPIGDGSLENSVTVIAGKGEQIWIGTKIGLCSINSETNQQNWFTISRGGLPHNYINSLFLDKAGILWVSTRSNILSYIQDGKVFKIPFNSATGTSTLGPITEDSFSRIWVGANGSGVFMIESDSIINFTVKEGLLSNYCYSITSDVHNNIWVGHKGGLSRIRIDDYSVKLIHHIENQTDNYQFNPNSIATDMQGKILFGSYNGIVSYDRSAEYSTFLPPVLELTSLTINGEEREISDKLILSPGNYKIRINFLGISLKEPEMVTYQYRLEGYEEWSEISKGTSVPYNNLASGKYTFVLKAASGDGIITDKPLTITIFIKTPAWKKWWFYPSIVLVIIGLTFIYIKRREYKFLSEKRILEEKVQERTQKIQFQKNEIELQRDLIDEKNINIIASIEYASHIQNAVLPPLELLDRLLPDNFILSKPKDIVSGDFYWMSEINNKIIIAVVDCTGHGVPGAFMSVLGITLLNSIVNIEGCTDSDDIVAKLRDRVLHSLKQGRKNVPTSDGMDITLCVIDKQQKKLQFTGAMNDLVYVRDGSLVVVKADRLSVGVYNDYFNPYTREEFEYKKGDVLYLFSDGFKDQFGGADDKKYLSRQLYARLLEIHSLPMSVQKEILDTEIIEWMKNTNQTDDITIMGIRL